MLAAVVRAALFVLCLVSTLPAQGGPPGGRPGGPPGGGPPAGVVPGGMPPGVAAGPDSATLQSEAIRVFLDCQGRVRGCDRDFFVTEINFVNWMRDRFDADVQLLVVALTNGGGGNANTITFIGRRGFAGMEDTLVVNSLPNDPEDKIRRDLARAFKLGLARYVAKSPIASRIDMRYAAPFGQRQQVSAANLNDPWNLWLYNVGTNLFVTAEEQQQRLNGSLNLSATRVTDAWKVNLSATGTIREDKFDVPARPGRDAFTLVNEQRTYNASSLTVRSLGDHWSAGLKLGVGYSDFLNQDLAVRVQPAIEYNVFPWTEQTRRQLTFLYNVGPNYYNYQRTTVFNLDEETRYSQQLTASLFARQPWGSSNISLDWINYLHDFDRNALTLSGSLDLRLGRGFSLDIRGSAARINDQIYLPRDGNTEEEILLQRQALQTGFRITTNIGIRYTFGSIYNTIVNQRFSSLGSSGGRFNFFFF